MMELPPQSWAYAKIADVCDVNPRSKADISLDTSVSFVPMSAVDEHRGEIVGATVKPYSEVMKGYTPFREGDVLFAKITPCMQNGKAAIATGLRNGIGFGSTEFHILRPKSVVLPEWLFFLVRTPDFRARAEASFQGAVGQQRVPQSFLEGFRIPIPSLREQSRIVLILQEAEQVRRLRAEAKAESSRLVQAIFRGMFGEPNSWGDPYRLGGCVRMVGGGTPSRDVPRYFSGDIPWATPKDVKQDYLDDAQEHITEEAVSKSATNVVPEGTVLIVVKSKILAHTIPMGITTRKFCFGQDLKGLIPEPGFTPEFVMASLLIQKERILARARGVNTEGLTLEALKSLTLPRVHGREIESFTAAVKEHYRIGQAMYIGDELSLSLIGSLTLRAFSGELTAAWRESNIEELRSDAANRDVALRSTSAPISGAARIVAPVTITVQRRDGAYAELTREQHTVLDAIQRRDIETSSSRWFTAEDLARTFDGHLRGNHHAVEIHLAVLAARGIVIAVSREEPAPITGEIVYGNAYRLPLDEYIPKDEDPREPVQGENARLRELERLATLLREEPTP